MRKRQTATATIVTVLSLALAGCGTGPDTDMSEAVAQTVAQHVGVMGFSSGGASASLDARASRTGGSADGATVSAAIDYDYSRTCSGGGDIQYSGTLTGDTVTNTMSFDADLDYNECTEPVLQESVTITTRPVFEVTADFSGVDDTTVNIESNVSGPFDWEMGGDSGNCSMSLTTNMTWTISQTESSVSGTTVGQICGREIDRSFESSVTTGS